MLTLSKMTQLLPDTITQTLNPILPFMPLDIDHKLLTAFYGGHVAAITGAGSGIGRALALNLAKAGCHVALADINEDNLKETARLLTKCPVTVTTTVVDVADKTAIDDWANEVMQAHGQVHFIFNNAGVALSSSVEGMSMDELDWVMGINFWGVVYGTKAFLPLIKDSVQKMNAEHHRKRRKHNGHIINISSLFGIVALPGQAAYNASKFAVRGFNESLRQELDIEKTGVSLTSVHPGGIKTNIANSARGNDSLSKLGMLTGEKALKKFNQVLKFDANDAALVILMAAANDQPRCLIGDDAKIIDAIQRLFPAHYGRVLNKAMKLGSRVQKRLKHKTR